MKRIVLLHLVLLLCNALCNAQSNSIDIGSANQNINPTTTFNAWAVTAEGPDMQNALCFDDGSGEGNSFGPPGSTPNSAKLSPVAIGSNAYTLTTYSGWPSGTYLSCFNGNTIYTPETAIQDGTLSGQPYNISSCTMTIRREFIICSNTSQTVNFSLNIIVDNYLTNVIIDADSSHPTTIYSTGAFAFPSPTNVTGTSLLTPGVHTIDIKCANGDWLNPTLNPGGSWYPFASTFYQWNPFGISISGNINTTSNVLLNTATNPTASAITGNTSICIDSTTTLSNATPGGSWSSSNTAVATVSQAGIVTGVTSGNTSINYTIGQGNCASTASVNLAVTNCNLSCPSAVPTNNIIITTGYNPTTQTSIPSGQQDSSWIVTAISPDMQNAFCNANTFGYAAPSGVTAQPVNIGQPAWVIQNFPVPWLQSESYLSCFPYNTMYTVMPAATNLTNCTMNISRNFFVAGTSNQNVNFNFSVSTDDGTKSITIDAGTPNAILLSPGGPGLNPVLTINTTKSLAPGLHTLTIQGANGEDVNGVYYTLPSGSQAQWNPFGIAVVGNITSSTNILQNKNCCTTTTSTIDTTICQGEICLGHTATGTYIDTLTNATGCDSIRTLNLTVTNCSIPCNNWLSTPSYQSYVDVGQVNIPGTQLTVEATINRTQPYAYGVGNGSDGDIVSKHLSPSDVNYLLRPTHAYITTSNGFFGTPDICAFNLNQTYHVAMVYDGSTLKFYRDGYLMASVPATGNLFQNNDPTRIGLYSGATIENFLGYINEVRIWNVARTQAQLKAYMDAPLPNPTTQAGLVAYYSFNNLLNKQGNTAYNGTLFGAASINATNTSCTFVVDSCCIPTTSIIDTTIYQGQTYLGHTTSGIYIDTITNITGCDSIRTVNLSVSNSCGISNAPTTNNLIINTGYNPVTQTYLTPGQHDPIWTVTAMTPDMQNAPCYENTTGGQAPTPGRLPVLPVAIGQNPYVYNTSGFISCFPYNTIYTPQVTTGNITNCQMTIRRNFFINSNSPQPVTFNFSIAIDDYVGSVIVDAGTGSPIVLFNNTAPPGNAGQVINSTITLSPGLHTLNIVCANWEQPNGPNQGIYYTVNGASMQWNPFAVDVSGSITSPGNVLQNILCCTPTYSTIDTTVLQGQNYLGHTAAGTYIDTITNVAGCDSIRTINLTVSNCSTVSISDSSTSCNNFYFKGIASNPTSIASWHWDFGDASTSSAQNIYHSYSTGGIYTVKLIIKSTSGCMDSATTSVNVTIPQIGFTAPDTVCLNAPVNIVNTSTCASSYYWSFCTPDINNSIPDGVNLGNPGNYLNGPVFSDYVKDNTGNYYVFVTNYTTGDLVRLDFGNNMLNTPTATDLGNFNGTLLAGGTEGIQVVYNENKWYAIIMGGRNNDPTSARIVKIEFGTSITNPSPVATNWGNIGALNYPHDITMFQQNGNWYGFVVNKGSSTVTLFDFSNSFNNIPSGTNLGNIGNMDNPTGVYTIYDNGNWHVFVVNSYQDDPSFPNYGTITRLDFGNSLLNTPTGVNLGNIGGLLDNSRDIYIEKICGNEVGFVVNQNSSDLVKLDFHDNITSTPTAVSLGNIGQMSSPHSISKFFRVGNDLYSFVTNLGNSITRLRFQGCTGINIPNSNAYTPPTITYSVPGTYTINLVTDDSLPTQSSYCKNIVVLNGPAVAVNNDTTICRNTSVQLTALANGAVSYQWTPDITLSSTTISNPIATPLNSATKYYVTATNATGCKGKDSVTVTIQNVPVKTNNDTAVCVGNTVQLNTTGANTYSWSPATGLTKTNIANPIDTSTIANTTQYIVTGTSSVGCNANDTINITINPNPIIQTSNDTAICISSSVQINTTGANTYSWSPITNLTNPAIANPIATPISTTRYFVTGTITSTGCFSKDSIKIIVNPKPTITKTNDTSICKNTSAPLFANGGVHDQWTPAVTLTDPNIVNPVATPSVNTTYYVTVTDGNSCSNNDSIKVTIRPDPIFTITPDTLVCSLNAVQLNASGGDIYSWTPTALVSNPNISNPLAETGTTTTYTVNITESTCNVSATLATKLSIAPPLNITINKSNDVDCSDGSAQLVANGAVTYNWLPADGLNNNAIANPIVSPLTTQQYIVRGNDTTTGCVGYDSITVYVNFADNNNAYLMANAFTPGSNINNCYGIKYWGVLEQVDFSIYNRWGTRVFHTNNPSDCWDGTFQGQPQQQDNYVYYITATTPCGHVVRKGNVLLIR
jgi:gliding motility-associated-like protein